MITISLNSYPQHSNHSFCIVVPSSNKYHVGNDYVFEDFGTKEYMGIKTLVSRDTFDKEALPDGACYMAKNCNAKLMFKILREQFKTRNEKGELYSFIDNDTLFDVLIFTEKSSIIPKVIEKPIVYDNTQSLLSKKLVIKSSYCHASKWNVAQRPYTESELIALNKI